MRALATCVCIFVIGCGPSNHRGTDGGGGDAANACSPDGTHQCAGASYQTCTGGQWTTTMDCPMACTDMLGCVACTPGQTFCKDGNVWSCDDTGKLSALPADIYTSGAFSTPLANQLLQAQHLRNWGRALLQLPY